jgi:hypothetical protein
MTFDKGLNSARVALKIGIGLAAFLAGLDKFFNLLADWQVYVSPLARAVLPVSAGTFMRVAGGVEMAVGLAILTRWTRIGSYVAAVWLLAIVANLLAGGRFLDVAVRDVEMAIAAYALARLTEAHESVRLAGAAIPEPAEDSHHIVTAA